MSKAIERADAKKAQGRQGQAWDGEDLEDRMAEGVDKTSSGGNGVVEILCMLSDHRSLLWVVIRIVKRDVAEA